MLLIITVAKNNVSLAIRDGEFGRPTVKAFFSVIPAQAGIQTGPRIGVRGDGHACGVTDRSPLKSAALRSAAGTHRLHRPCPLRVVVPQRHHSIPHSPQVWLRLLRIHHMMTHPRGDLGQEKSFCSRHRRRGVWECCTVEG